MINKSPIFVNGFARGGTNLIINLLASHPDVCLLSGETQEVFHSEFKSRIDRVIREMMYLPIRIANREDTFGHEYFQERNNVLPFMERYIDSYFYFDKIINSKNEFKSEGTRYSKKEIKNSRFLAKNVNGVVFTSDLLSKIYPDATFIAIVRDGLALCEGYVRRGVSAKNCGKMYEMVCKKIIQDAKTIPNYHIVRFEDMMEDIVGFMKTIYLYANLDIDKVQKVRLQAKRSMTTEGNRSYTFGENKDREVLWFEMEKLFEFIRSDVNENQIKQLKQQDKHAFLQQAEYSINHFGYDS